MTEHYGFKVGDKVKWGGVNGVVEQVDLGKAYPVRASFQGHLSGFTLDGRYWASDTEPSLKLRKFKPAQAPLFKVGDKVKWRGANGVVKRVTPGALYPVMVYLEGYDMVGFTLDGRRWGSETKPILKLRKFKKKEAATQRDPVSFVLDGKRFTVSFVKEPNEKA